jgi:hypothetical protein
VNVERKRSEWFDMLIDCHREFVAAITESRPSTLDAAEGTRVIEFVNALYQSAASGEPVTLPIATTDYTKTFEQLCDGSLGVPGAPRR